MSQFFSGTDYLLTLPMILLTLFALGILLIDLMLEPSLKWVNPVTAFSGILFSAGGVYKIQHALAVANLPSQAGLSGSVLVDHFSLYFWYLFLAGTAISILVSVRYLEIEHEH